MSRNRSMLRRMLSPFWSPSSDESDAAQQSLSLGDDQDEQELSPERGELGSNHGVDGQCDDQPRERASTQKAPYVSALKSSQSSVYSDIDDDILPAVESDGDNASGEERAKHISGREGK